MDEHKNLLINLLGSTYSELRKVENSIIDGSNNLRGRSDTIKNELTRIVSTNNQPQHHNIPQPVNITTHEATAISPPVNEVDDRQLVFNFEVNEKEVLFKKLDSIEKKLDILLKKGTKS